MIVLARNGWFRFFRSRKFTYSDGWDRAMFRSQQNEDKLIEWLGKRIEICPAEDMEGKVPVVNRENQARRDAFEECLRMVSQNGLRIKKSKWEARL